jgi:dipeptide/tripeptide permease
MDSHGWRFPPAFWTANLIELGERAAFYGWFIMLASFLTDVVKYTDIQAGFVGAVFAAGLYFLPFLTGAFADRVGYRRALLLALALLASGYLGLGLWPKKGWVLLPMASIMVGGALFKPIITGTVARSSNSETRARAFSLFYMMVNIGSFFGKTAAKPIRVHAGLSYTPLCSATVAAVALVAVALFYFPKASTDENQSPASLRDAVSRLFADLREVLKSGRLMAIVLITAGFWIIQSQMYSSMPKYVLRMVGADASPEWYANINPIMVTLLVVPVTQLARRIPAVASIAIAMGLIPISALIIAGLPLLINSVALPGALRVGPLAGAGGILHPVTVAMALGIAMQGLSECFLSPRYLEYASRQAPPGKEALYMGYAHMNNFFAWLFGYVLSGFLLDAFCPDPARLEPTARITYQDALCGNSAMPVEYAHAHYLWYAFAAIGAVAFVLLLVFARVTSRADAAAAKA